MKSHSSTLLSRILRAGSRPHVCRYRVVAVGLDSRSRIIGIRTNTPRLLTRGYHAEERLIHSCPRSLSLILIARIGALGSLLPIHPCAHCAKIAERRGVVIKPVRPSLARRDRKLERLIIKIRKRRGHQPTIYDGVYSLIRTHAIYGGIAKANLSRNTVKT